MAWLYLSIFIFLPTFIGAEEGNTTKWTAESLPNPQTGGSKECGMMSSANICDPDEMLPQEARYRLNHNLQQLESRTRQDKGATFCEKKGITGAMVVVRRLQDGKSQEKVTQMAKDLLAKWDLDHQCQKAILILLSIEDHAFWVARMDRVPIKASDFNDLFAKQKNEFKQKNYHVALSNILEGTWELALKMKVKSKPKDRGEQAATGTSIAKQEGQVKATGGEGRAPKGHGSRKSKQEEFHLPAFLKSKRFWFLIIFIVIPLLLCCCCFYYCCCRKSGKEKGYNGYHRASGDDGGEGGGDDCERGGFTNGPGIGGIGTMAGEFLAGLSQGNGGGGLSGLLRGGGEGDGDGEGEGEGEGEGQGQGEGEGDNSSVNQEDTGDGGSNETPASPTQQSEHGDDNDDDSEDEGLYPSDPVKDDGGGGTWSD